MTETPNQSISLLRLPDVMARTGFKRATVWNMVKDGRFPKPIQIGLRAIAWPSTSIDSWIQGCIDKADKVGC